MYSFRLVHVPLIPPHVIFSYLSYNLCRLVIENVLSCGYRDKLFLICILPSHRQDLHNIFFLSTLVLLPLGVSFPSPLPFPFLFLPSGWSLELGLGFSDATSSISGAPAGFGLFFGYGSVNIAFRLGAGTAGLKFEKMFAKFFAAFSLFPSMHSYRMP